ncbi:MAG: cysteine--tRNA ligase [Candidatus Nealsonbacteria bacterium]|nr:MAG: cysteine--tRNA ligase [Candidatus Nealsonbacteria bacterium]
MIKLYNTLTRKKETFKPRKHKVVELFVCGPTTYDFAHLGHARTYLAFDIIVKYLRKKGYDLFYLQNITDIDDKIIKRAKEKKISPQKLASRFEKEYLKNMKELGINSVTRYARATDHIKEIISQIKRLKEKGFAYQIKDGIYYDIKKFKGYGKLSRRTASQTEDALSRIDQSRGKRNKGDFCLWKFSKKGEPKWKSPWGEGRPGWHIEDTAIAEKYFGWQYDMHGGARDLIFPHHEAEIAQMEALSGKSPMVKYWLHTGFLTVKGQKMAKSLGNFITVQDFIKKHSPRLLRYMMIKNHYLSPMDYNENAVLQAERELERIDEFINKIQITKSEFQNKSKILISEFKMRFTAAMENNFNTPEAMAVIFELINRGNSLMDENLLGKKDKESILKFFKEIDEFLGFIFWKKPKEKVPQNVLKLAEEREKYRKKKNWQKADEIRKEIVKLGWWLEDTKSGPKIKKLI